MQARGKGDDCYLQKAVRVHTAADVEPSTAVTICEAPAGYRGDSVTEGQVDSHTGAHRLPSRFGELRLWCAL